MLVRRLARPLLGSMYVLGGIDQARHPGEKTPAAEGVVKFLSERTSAPVPDVATVVRLDGIAKAVAGIGLSLGRAPRLSAAVLSASLIPTTLAAHAFWKIEDPDQRGQQKLEFFKNASMLGGLLLAAVDTAGKPSVAWRTRRAARRLAKNVGTAAESTSESAERVARRTRKALPV
ncbi:MAG: DoxX family protein [Geodermatophilaceae bacterium]|nr:DoxX family protein [Geodermatophilaceae bacterium]